MCTFLAYFIIKGVLDYGLFLSCFLVTVMLGSL